MYYWVTHPHFGLPQSSHTLVGSIPSYSSVSAAFTWGPILLELLLAAAVVMRRSWWPPLLAAGLLFHVAIGLVHGLGSFGLTMSAGLLLYLRSEEQTWAISLPTIPRIGKARLTAERGT